MVLWLTVPLKQEQVSRRIRLLDIFRRGSEVVKTLKSIDRRRTSGGGTLNIEKIS